MTNQTPTEKTGVGLKPWLAKLVKGQRFSVVEAEEIFGIMMAGEASMAQMGALLMGLRLRHETADEIAGAAKAMRNCMLTVKAPDGSMDIVGTGGDQSGSLNISTAAALVVAACGVTVAKHGNRAASSQSGSADVLTSLGIDLQRPVDDVERAITKCGFGFMLAQNHHKAVRNVMPARVEVGVPTIFNFLGPLCNPAQVRRSLIGCFDGNYVGLMAEALLTLGIDRAWVVHGQTADHKPLDEISLSGPTQVSEVYQGKLRHFTLTPEEAGLSLKPNAKIGGGSADDNAAAIQALLEGKASDYRDIVLFNAAAALVIAERVSKLKDGVELAAHQIDNGSALTLLAKLRECLGNG